MKKQNNRKTPIVTFTQFSFDESQYQYGNKKWDAPTLVEYCKRNKYPVFDMPLACVNISMMPWKLNSFNDFMWHLQRIKNADLTHPIILDDDGIICDGWHRIAKAMMDNKSTIKAIRMENMPEPSGVTKVNEN